MNVVKKDLYKIEGMEDYKFYYVTTEGHIYSNKYTKTRRLRPYKHNGSKPYLLVKLFNGKGKSKSFFIHHIVANASLDDYISRYGLKKTMYILENSCS
jgi:hypothetical protein